MPTKTRSCATVLFAALLLSACTREGCGRPPPERPVPACEPGDKECPVKPPAEPAPLPTAPNERKAEPADDAKREAPKVN